MEREFRTNRHEIDRSGSPSVRAKGTSARPVLQDGSNLSVLLGRIEWFFAKRG